VDFVVGTHALLSKNVAFSRLGLIITDEQHRFGVEQRATLSAKGEGAHTLVMSATPIPRTLALLMYGELDVSVLDELPPGRTPVKTYAVTERYRERIDGFIRKTVDEGGQVFVVCPMIESEDGLPQEGVQEAVAVQARLQKLFPDLEIGLAHGKMKSKERQAVMDRFSAGEAAVLVATTVIEVGVDVPNANLMIVENAERFGLAQLHQLRGRVGRGRRESYCVLFNGGGGELAAKRLGMLEKSNDGFAIAELDLAIRGPGEFFGTRQHGLPTLRVADLNADAPILDDAREAARELLADDPKLSGCEALRGRVEELIESLES
jgi:ATP-dependent DNA helicase RecG